ncbi:MAG: DNA-directed RNA polymerase [Thermoprotei archaeon]|nr:MAG: DNA-directed RNA polymerase [Thermoprotei archaeon]
MFKVVKMKDIIRIPPRMFSLPLEDSALTVLKENFEGRIIRDLGLIVSILDVDVEDIGKIAPGDGAVYHVATFNALVFTPMLKEVVEGEVITVEDFGLLVRIGPVDAFIHKSQIHDDYFSFSREQSAMLGSKTGRIVRKGDKVRARIVQVSYGGQAKILKIGLTMRQPYLGKIEWIEHDVRKAREAVKSGET